MLHKFQFHTDLTGQCTQVVMDGNELRGVIESDIHYAVNEIPTVTLTFLTADVVVESDRTKVKKEV